MTHICLRFFAMMVLCLLPFSGNGLEMSLEEKVGQLLIVCFHGTVANEESEKLIQEAHVGGFIYYQWANELTSPDQVKTLTYSLQKSSKIPLFISVDQEGGIVNRLKQGFTYFPGNAALGQAEAPHLTEEAAFAMGKELAAVGVNLNYAPVVDVNSNPANPIIGIRSFGKDPQRVASLGARALAGFMRAGIIPTLKHFPGHGDVSVDSHVALPIVYKTMHELTECEWIPFLHLIPEAPLIMTAHLMMPALDAKVPVTFSEKVVNGLLRNEMGFEGVIMTDSLVMQGLQCFCDSLQESALRALQAGHDLLLFGGRELLGHQQELSADEILVIHRYLVEAVRQGKISEEKINRSVERILKLKNDAGLFKKKEIGLTFHSEEHQKLARLIAKKALQLGLYSQLLSLENKKVCLIAPTELRPDLEKMDVKNLKLIFYERSNPSLEECGDLNLIISYNSWKYPKLQPLLTAIPNAFYMIVADPYDTLFLHNPQNVIYTYSPAYFSLQAALDFIFSDLTCLKRKGYDTDS